VPCGQRDGSLRPYSWIARPGVTQSLKLRPYKKKSVLYALQLYNPDSRIHFCSLFLQSVAEGDTDLQ
jgi:hypothetical protein